MRIAAFDPGKIASYAIFDSSAPFDIEVGTVRLVGAQREVRPCGVHICEIVGSVDQAIVEKVGAMPGQGVTSMFTFGMCTGAILGAIAAMGRPLERVEPQQWKLGSRLNGLKDDAAKTAARQYAKELWPQHAKIFDVAKNHGIAEAALMARWYFLKGPGRDIDIDPESPVKKERA